MKKVFTMAMALGLCSILKAQPGSLDNSFSGDGIVLTHAGFSSSGGSGVAIQSDGKILVAGNANDFTGDEDFALLRYTSAGVLDNTFGNGGIAFAGFGGPDYGNAIAIQSNGKIVVVGSADDGSDVDFAIARFNSNGTLDNTFSSNGQVRVGLGGKDYANAVFIQSDGKIVVAGTTGNGSTAADFAVVRLTSGGNLDGSFGSGGIARINFGGYDDARSVAKQSDGKIVIAGYTYAAASGTSFGIARLNTNGTADNTFSGNGRTIIDFAGGEDYAYGIAVQPNGKIVVAGDSYSNVDKDEDFALARLNSNGSLDNTFSSDGKTTTGFGHTDYGQCLALQTDGKIVVAGATQTSSDVDFAVARYNSNGTLDNTFSSDGKTTTGLGGTDYGKSVAIQSNGKIVVAGSSGTNNFAVVRYIGGNSIAVGETAEKTTTLLTPSLSLYPNPASDFIHIKGLKDLSGATVSIADRSGNILKTGIAAGSEYELNIQQLKPGMYSAVITEDGKITNITFIKE